MVAVLEPRFLVKKKAREQQQLVSPTSPLIAIALLCLDSAAGAASSPTVIKKTQEVILVKMCQHKYVVKK